MKRLGRILESIANIGGYFSGWLVPAMMVLVFVEVFTRYVVRQPLMIADELSAYMLVAIAYLAAAYTQKEGGQVRITALVTRLPTRVASWLRLVTLSLLLLFALAITHSSYTYMALSFKLGMKSGTWLRVPLQPIQMTVAIGFAILFLVVIVELVRAIRNIRAGKSAEELTE